MAIDAVADAQLSDDHAQDVPEEIAESRQYLEPSWSPWVAAAGPSLRAVVDDVVTQALNAERILAPFRRKRVRRAADLEAFKATIGSLVAHVAHERLRGADGVRLSLDSNVLRRSSRYRSPLHGSKLPQILDLLSCPELAFLNVTKGHQGFGQSAGRQTTVSAGSRLVTRLEANGVTLDDIQRRPGEEIVMLKGTKAKDGSRSSLVEYDDSELTEQYRQQTRELNVWLADADVTYLGSDKRGDDGDRVMRRYFTRNDWFSGGRLFGGFWQRLRKADRLANVEIDGQAVVSLDFRAMLPSLAYAYVGQRAPEDDLYAVTFTDAAGSPRVLPRDVVKKVFSAALNGAKEWPRELREHRAGMSWTSVVAALAQHHPALAVMFGADHGQSLAFTESSILLDVLFRLKEAEVVALPVHDCIVVAESNGKIAEQTMLHVFKLHCHQDARVTIERAKETV